MSGIEEILAVIGTAVGIAGGILTVVRVVKQLIDEDPNAKAKIQHIKSFLKLKEKQSGRKIIRHMKDIFYDMYDVVRIPFWSTKKVVLGISSPEKANSLLYRPPARPREDEN
jgi:uncharacterized protein YneF (UPF0154 family)